jgi:O-antigen/teichoic acid export membrane protein
MTKFERIRSFLVPKLRQILHFLTRQGIAMAANLLYGLLCVRMLPVLEYAKFAVLFGFMGSLVVLLDVGISNTLAPLVGEQTNDLQLIANYVASIRKLALRLYLVVVPFAAIIFALLVRKQHWGTWVVAQMLVVLLWTAWFGRVASSYGSVLILRRDRSQYYRIQIIASLGSLALLLVFWALHRMNIYVGILLNVAQTVYIAVSFFYRARKILAVKGVSSPQQEKAVIHLAMPNSAGLIFYAVQGQLTLMLITVFGHNPASVANVGALSRLGQILVIFAQMNPVLVEPFFAKLPASRLLRTYLLTVALALVGGAGLTGLAFLFPEALLWIIGPKYSHLRFEVGLQILVAVIWYILGLLWVINSSRRFVYWWNNLANIILTISVQAFIVWKFDLSTVRSVLMLNGVSALISLTVHIACSVYGFRRGPQKLYEPAMHENLESSV